MLRKDFGQFIDDLNHTYTEKNLKHLVLIQYIQTLYQQTKNNKLAAGMMVLGATTIKKNAIKLLPQKITILGNKIKGSDLFDILQKGLHDYGYTGSCQLLICLAELYDYFEKHPKQCESLIHSQQCKSFFSDKKNLYDELDEIIKELFREQSKMISDWIGTLVSPDYLKEKIVDITTKYRMIGNHTHDHYADLMDFVNITCEIQGTPNEKLLNANQANVVSQPYRLRFAVILFVMGYIESKYAFTRLFNWQPEHSVLYSVSHEFVKDIFGIDRVTDYCPTQRRSYLKSLDSYLENDMFSVLKESKLYQDNKELFDKVEKKISGMREKIKTQLKPLETLKPTPSVTSNVGTSVKSVTQYGVNTVVGKAISYALIPDISKQIMRSVGGSVGFLFFGPTGALMGIYLADHANTDLLPTTLSNLCTLAVNPIGETIGSITKSAICVLLYPAEKGFNYVFSDDPELKSKQEECIANNQEFIQALLKLPEKFISANKKEILQSVQYKNW